MAKASREDADAHIEALGIALNHPAVTSDARSICAMARVCKGWRAAVQQSAAGSMDIIAKRNMPLLKLTQLLGWLPKHAGLVRSLTINKPERGSKAVAEVPYRTYKAAAEQMLQFALSACHPSSTAATLAGMSAPRFPLHLQSFSSDYLAAPGVIAAMPAATLTRLELRLRIVPPVNGSALATALAGLSGLQDFKLTVGFHSSSISLPTCLAGVHKLTQLTSLHIDACERTWQQPLQLLLQQPLLRLQHLQFRDHQAQLQFSHLNGLLGLTVLGPAAIASRAGLQLPARLTSLDLGRCNMKAKTALEIPCLQQLQRLTLLMDFGDDNHQVLQHLARLPQLQLALEYLYPEQVLSTAAVWQHLPQLRQLDVQFYSTPSEEQFTLILQSIANATQLTSLKLPVIVEGWSADMRRAILDSDEEGPSSYPGEVCSYLKGLSNLKSLELDYNMHTRREDCLHLATLTGLTRLNLEGAAGAVGELVAVALACNLTRLQSLALVSCGLNSMTCAPAIAQLTGLTELNLRGTAGLTEQRLMMLTTLNNLCKLNVKVCKATAAATAAAVDRFWAAMGREPQQ